MSLSCERGGVRTRGRECNNPSPQVRRVNYQSDRLDGKVLFIQGAGADCDGDDIEAEACTGDGQGSCEFEFPPAWKPEFSVTKVTN